MFCTNCGADLPEGAQFCVECGAAAETLPMGRESKAPEPTPASASDPAADAKSTATDESGTAVEPTEVAKPLVQEPSSYTAKPAETTAAPDASAKKPSPLAGKTPLIIAAVAALAVVGIIVFFVTRGAGGSSTRGPEPTTIAVEDLDESVDKALSDAADLADTMATRYAGYFDPDANAVANSQSTTTFEETRARIGTETKRLNDDLAAIEAAGDFTGRDQAVTAMNNLAEILAYELDVCDMQEELSSNTQKGAATMLTIIQGLYDGYAAIDPPTFLKVYEENTLDKMPVIYDALVYTLSEPDSTLSQLTSRALMQWWITKQNSYDNESNTSVINQCKASKELLSSIVGGSMISGAPSVSVDAIDRISPNLYPSLDAAALVGITAYDANRTVTVSAEVVGFTQPFEEKFKLTQGYNHLPIKPATLPVAQMDDLTSNTDTQLNIKVIDDKTGAVLAQKSQPVQMMSKYDFSWVANEFGATVQFDILAWMRPQCDEVLALNRKAADILGEWTNGQFTALDGYQHGDDWSYTLLQTAAIQKAMSDAGVVYVMDNYSFTATQHILTPDQVVQKKQGLCIESSLTLASCLLSAGMHPMIILIPGHAQVAVETYRGSGQYFLIETTTLPYAGINTDYSINQSGFWNGLLGTMPGSDQLATPNGTSDEWAAYLSARADGSDEYGGVFVVDCILQKDLGIQGIETL